MTSLVWFRNDLRVADNPALDAACADGPAYAVFCICSRQWRQHSVGDNRLGFLLDSLHALRTDLASLGIPLLLADTPRFRDVPAALGRIAAALAATTLDFNEEYPLNERVRDSQVARHCEASGVRVRMHHAGTIQPPGTVLTFAGEPYTVFTPFKRRWLAGIDRRALRPLDTPPRQAAATPVHTAAGGDGADTPLLTSLPASIDGVPRDRVAADWPGGSREAARRLDRFVHDALERYREERDFPALSGTSVLSPYLAVGAISARQCLDAAITANEGRLEGGHPGIQAWITELVWRDFYRHVIAQFPHVSRGQAFRTELDAIPWRRDPGDLQAWQQGCTGYPLVDAAMRQLNTTGWMHNRLRMVTAMFLTKHLLIDWRLGERYFMTQLVDGDFAANNGGWQWSASTGTDAAPYFRIFNPVTQARRFDPDGVFVRRHVAELADAPGRALFEPSRHGISGYPSPIVDHRAARLRALETFKAAR